MFNLKVAIFIVSLCACACETMMLKERRHSPIMDELYKAQFIPYQEYYVLPQTTGPVEAYSWNANVNKFLQKFAKFIQHRNKGIYNSKIKKIALGFGWNMDNLELTSLHWIVNLWTRTVYVTKKKNYLKA